MTAIPRAALLSTLARSFAIQATWNYRTLIGCGFAFAMLPMLRTIYAQRPGEYQAAVQRHTTIFNSHPYLAPMALGAVTVLEATETPEVVARFKDAVRGSLGSLGDRLIWAGFRPLCVLLALTAVALGAGWAFVTLAFLLVYNIGHVGTRVWALQFGLRHGRRLAEQLRSAPVERIQDGLQVAGAFTLGVLSVLVLGGRLTGRALEPATLVAGIAAAALGVRFAGRVRWALVFAITVLTLASLALGAVR